MRFASLKYDLLAIKADQSGALAMWVMMGYERCLQEISGGWGVLRL